jgi:hypothetical protein
VLTFHVPHAQSVEHALEQLQKLVASDPRIGDVPAKPWIAVTDYTDTGVKMNVGVWTRASDHASVQADLLRQIQPLTKPEPEPRLDAPANA